MKQNKKQDNNCVKLWPLFEKGKLNITTRYYITCKARVFTHLQVTETAALAPAHRTAREIMTAALTSE